MSDSPFNDRLREQPAVGPAATAESKPTTAVLILVQVRDEDVEKASKMISRVVDAIIGAEGTVFHIISALVIGSFDFGSSPGSHAEERCESAAFFLRKDLGNDCKILYGVCKAVYGNFGTTRRLHFGPFISNMAQLLNELENLEFGAVRKMHSSQLLSKSEPPNPS